jgi:hypothetical protein
MERAEASDRLGHDRSARCGERRHPEARSAPTGDRLDLRFGVRESRQDHVRVTNERLTRLGRPHTARAAHDQRRSGLALQRRDLLGDRGLGQAHGGGGGGERPVGHDGAQDPEPANVEHDSESSVW